MPKDARYAITLGKNTKYCQIETNIQITKSTIPKAIQADGFLSFFENTKAKIPKIRWKKKIPKIPKTRPVLPF